MFRNQADRKRKFGDVQQERMPQQTYNGPEEFVEAGTRGFLVSSLPDKEGYAVDDALYLLRAAAIKLKGGVKAGKKFNQENCPTYVRINFADPSSIEVLPNPDGEEDDKEEDVEEKDAVNEGSKETAKKESTDKDDKPENLVSEDKANADEKPSEDSKDEKEAADKKESVESQEGNETKEDNAKKEETKEAEKETKEDEKEADNKVENSKQDSENDSEDKNSEEEKMDTEVKDDKKEEVDSKDKKNEDKDNKKEEDVSKEKKDEGTTPEKSSEDKRTPKQKKRPEKPFMKTPFKFKAFRTEIRNLMFIKTDFPLPMALAQEAMELVLQRGGEEQQTQQALQGQDYWQQVQGRQVEQRRGAGVPVGEATQQIMPVLGVCNFDLFELEIMTRRVLAPLFPLDQNLSVGILLFDKLAEPGTHLILETVRNALWSVNPLIPHVSPLCEPDVTVRIEVIGSKIILCAMNNWCKYRQYSPVHLHELGPGSPEDDDLTHIAPEERVEAEKLRVVRIQQKAEKRVRDEIKRKQREEEQRIREQRKAERLAARRKQEEEEDKRREEAAKRRRIAEEEKRVADEERKKKEEEEKKIREAAAAKEVVIIEDDEASEGKKVDEPASEQEEKMEVETETAPVDQKEESVPEQEKDITEESTGSNTELVQTEMEPKNTIEEVRETADSEPPITQPMEAEPVSSQVLEEAAETPIPEETPLEAASETPIPEETPEKKASPGKKTHRGKRGGRGSRKSEVVEEEPEEPEVVSESSQPMEEVQEAPIKSKRGRGRKSEVVQEVVEEETEPAADESSQIVEESESSQLYETAEEETPDTKKAKSKRGGKRGRKSESQVVEEEAEQPAEEEAEAPEETPGKKRRGRRSKK